MPLTNEIDQTGFMWEFGADMGATLVFAQHRDHGEEMQVLSDFAHLIANLPSTVVVTFGSGYSGKLAAWLRIKYPHLVEGALASSAPVLVSQTLDHYSMYETTFAKAAGRICLKELREYLTEHKDDLLAMSVEWANLASRGTPLTEACALLAKKGLEYTRVERKYTCADLTAARAIMGEYNWKKVSTTCTDRPLDSVEFGNDVHAIAAMSNIVWSNGDLDPWSQFGLTSCDDKYDCPTSVLSPMMAGAAFAVDLKFADPLDSSELVSTRRLETAHISSWIEARLLRSAKIEPQHPGANLPNVNVLIAN